MTVTPPQQLTGVRKLVVERAAELRLSLAELSRSLGRNTAYFHQYIHQGSPKHLAEDIRHRLALLLGVDEQQLREASSRPAPGALRAGQSVGRHLAGHDTPPHLPLFPESQATNRNEAAYSAPIMLTKAGPADFAIWIEQPHGRIQVGDIAYVQIAHPVRPGDQVIIVVERKIQCIGELAAITDAAVTVVDNGTPRDFQRHDVSVQKIVGVAYP
ncbi:MAG TPA: hypothetical protein VIZ17_09185 [Acetobacteraceae bacterium]